MYALEKFSKYFLFTLEVLLFCIIHPRCVAERCDSSLSVRTGFDVTGFTRNCVTLLQSVQIQKLKNADTHNTKPKLQTITRNFGTLWYEERIISFCKYKVSLKRKAPERKEPQQRTSYQTNFLAVCKCAFWIKSIVLYSHQAIHHDTNIWKYRWFRLSWNASNLSQIISRSNFQITSTNKLFIETWTLSNRVDHRSRDCNAVTNPPTHWQNVCWKNCWCFF